MNRSLIIAGSAIAGTLVGALALNAQAAFTTEEKTTVVTLTSNIIDCSAPGTHCLKVFIDPKNVLRVDSDPLVKTGQNTVVYWFIEPTPNHLALEFAADGIAFVSSAGRMEFKCTSLDINPITVWRCFDVAGTAADALHPDVGYKYAVTVIDGPNGKKSIDPNIINN